MLQIEWDAASREQWSRLIALAPRCALQQDWSYGEAVAAQGHIVRRAVVRDRGGRPVALVQAMQRQLLGPVAATMLMRGPVWLDALADQELEPALSRALRQDLAPCVLLWTPETGEGGRRWQGLRRVMTGYSTIWLDLRPALDAIRAGLDGKWRNMLVRAEAGGLRVRACSGGTLVDWLVEANERYRRSVGYRGPTPVFIQALGQVPHAAQSRLALIAMEGQEPVAGVILQRHGTSATYYVGCTSPRGRELRAHHLLLWNAITALKELGAQSLDLGGVDTVNAPGLARFKLGLGGEVTTLAGTYLAPPVRRLAS